MSELANAARLQEPVAENNETADRNRRDGRRRGWLAAGSLFGALASSSCCLLPLALFGLGASGAWIGNLTALAPYQPIFITVTLVFLVVGFRQVYIRSRAACAERAACSAGATRLAKLALWAATALVAAAIAFPYAAPYLLGL